MLTDLTPGSLYHFKVTAESAVGSSPDSKVGEERLPPDQPGKLQVIKKSHNSVQLKWEKPKHGAHLVRSYSIYYRSIKLNDYSEWFCTQTSSCEECLVLTKLTPGSVYHFKVKTESTEGSSPASEMSIVRLPPDQPGKPFATQVTPNTIGVQWAKPKNGAESVVYYIVWYRSVDDQSDQWSSQSTIEAQEYAWLTNLVPNRSYIVKVQAVSFAGASGPESEPSDGPIETLLPPPGKPHAANITGNSVQLSWEKPEHGAESVQMYTVSYCSVNEAMVHWQAYEYSNRNCSVLVKGLVPNKTYVFKVRAETNAGSSPYSELSDPIETLLPPPGKPYATEVRYESFQIN